jgi:hypothetical protein
MAQAQSANIAATSVIRFAILTRFASFAGRASWLLPHHMHASTTSFMAPGKSDIDVTTPVRPPS